MKVEALLWSGIIIGPLVWFIALGADFALAPLACSGKSKLVLGVISAAALVLTIVAGWISLVQWQVPERNANGEVVPARPRRRAMALAGLGLSGLFAITIFAQAIPTLLMAGCE